MATDHEMDVNDGKTCWEILPAVTQSRLVLFPGVKCEAVVGSSDALKAIHEGMASWGPKTIALCTARGRKSSPPDLYDVGTVAEIVSLRKGPGEARLVVQLLVRDRLRIHEHLQVRPFRIARVARIVEPDEDPDTLRCLVAALRGSVRRTLAAHPPCSNRNLAGVDVDSLTGAATRVLAAAMEALRDLPVAEQQRALELPSLGARLDLARALLDARLAALDPRTRLTVH